MESYPQEEILNDVLKDKQDKQLVEEFFAWIKEQTTGATVLPKDEMDKGLKYCIN